MIASEIAGHLLLLFGLLSIWHVERNRLFSILQSPPQTIDDTTKTLVPIWWGSLALMFDATAGLPGMVGFAVVSVIAAIVLLACTSATRKRALLAARPVFQRRLLNAALLMLTVGSVLALFNAAERYETDRAAHAVSTRAEPVEGTAGRSVQ